MRCMEEALSYIIKRDREGGRRSTRRGGKGREVGDLRGDFLFFFSTWRAWMVEYVRRKKKRKKRKEGKMAQLEEFVMIYLFLMIQEGRGGLALSSSSILLYFFFIIFHWFLFLSLFISS